MKHNPIEDDSPEVEAILEKLKGRSLPHVRTLREAVKRQIARTGIHSRMTPDDL